MEIYERVRKLRNYLKLSQEAFGKKLGVSRSVINNLESNVLVRPENKISLIKLMCKEFNVSEEWLINGKGGNEPIFENNQFNVEQYAINKGATNIEIEILKAYFDLDKNIRKEVIKHFVNHFTKKTCFDKTTDEFIDDLNQNENDNFLKKELD